MKKFLSFVLLFSVVTFVYGQKLNLIEKESKIVSEKVIVDNGSSTGVVAPYLDPKDIEVIELTQSGNIWSTIEESANQVGYNARLNTVIHGHRSYGGDGTGHLYLDFSNDGGINWTTDVDIASSGDGVVRYPQVAIVDNGTDAKVVGCGWDIPDYKVFTAISDIDGTNASSQFNALAATGHLYGVPTGLCSDADGSKFYFAVNEGEMVGSELNKTDILCLITGDISSGTPVLTEARIDMDITNAPSSETTVLDFILNKDIAFSKTTPGLGYAAVTAYDDGHQLPDNVHPGLHVWKTVDFGASWDRLPTFDWMSLSVIADSIEAASGEIKRPSFSSISLGVDANDKLHVFAQINSGPATTGQWFGIQTEAPFLNHYYDLITENGTSWEAVYIAPYTGEAYEYHTGEKDYQTPYMEVSFSQDDSKVFCVWSETVGEVENSAPDVMVVGFDVNNYSSKTVKKNLSEATDAETASYFAFTSSKAIETGADNNYQIPIVYCEPGNTDLDPINYYYLTGAGVNNGDFSAVNNISENNINIYPNPASDVISIDNVKNVEISICNIYGSEVIKTNKTKIDISNLANGAYFVNIDDGIQVVTKKIVVLQ